MISFNKQAPKDWIKSLNQFGHFKDQLNLSDHIKQLVYEQKWEELDALLMQATAADGVIYQYMSQFVKFTKMEFIIAVRDAKNEWEEDGIWHDDGSRVMAFTLSLTIDAEKIEGGVLELRQRGSTESIKFPTPEIGNIIIFQTGESGWEHKINRVTKGTRVIMACWCS